MSRKNIYIKSLIFALLLSKLNADLKNCTFIFLFLCFACYCHAQKLQLKINGESDNETIIINTIGYQKAHLNGKSVIDEVNLMSNQLTIDGYMENHIIENKKLNDSTFTYKFSLEKQVDSIHIYIGINSVLNTINFFNKKNDTVALPFDQVENFLKETLNKLESKGYALAKLKLIDIKKHNNILTANLELKLDNQRQLNGIVIKGYEKFPVGFKKNFERTYKNETFNKENLNNIYKDFEKIRFTKQTRYPEILFEKDSTKIYVYLEKTKTNSFDGFIGFANDTDGKIEFNGFLDVNLINNLNSGEVLSIYWKSGGSNQTVFNAAIELPYIFKSPFAFKANLNIFKQDSTFQNTKTAINLGYFLKYNSRLFLGYQSTESSDIQNQKSSNISDYKNYFITSNYEFIDYNADDNLFPIKTNIFGKIGFGSRESQTSTSNQFFANINLEHNFYLNQRNIINIRSQNYYLQSQEYLVNELYRFGGVYSIQGFKEDSLQGNLFTSILTEYRYVFTPTLYLNTIIDYGYYQDKSNNSQGNLYSLGIGLGLLTKNGLFKLIYAAGSSNNQSLDIKNAIVHVSFKTNF